MALMLQDDTYLIRDTHENVCLFVSEKPIFKPEMNNVMILRARPFSRHMHKYPIVYGL